MLSYFSAKATLLQRQTVKQWLEDPAQVGLFFANLHKWEKSNRQYQVDATQAIVHKNVDLQKKTDENEC